MDIFRRDFHPNPQPLIPAPGRRIMNVYSEDVPSDDVLTESRALEGSRNTSPTEGKRRPRTVGELQTQGPPKGPQRRSGKLSSTCRSEYGRDERHTKRVRREHGKGASACAHACLGRLRCCSVGMRAVCRAIRQGPSPPPSPAPPTHPANCGGCEL